MLGLGMFLGAMLGLLSGVISVRISFEMGKSDAFIREGCEYFHVGTMVICGVVAGMVYGIMLNSLAQTYKKRVPQKLLFKYTFLLAIPVYLLTDYFAVTFRHGGISLCGHLVVFLGSLGIAFLLLRRKEQVP